MPASNANIKVFNSYAESLKLYNLYFIPHACICIFFKPEQWKYCTKLTQLHILIGTHSTNPVYLLLINKKELTRRGVVFCPFSFLLLSVAAEVVS